LKRKFGLLGQLLIHSIVQYWRLSIALVGDKTDFVAGLTASRSSTKLKFIASGGVRSGPLSKESKHIQLPREKRKKKKGRPGQATTMFELSTCRESWTGGTLVLCCTRHIVLGLGLGEVRGPYELRSNLGCNNSGRSVFRKG